MHIIYWGGQMQDELLLAGGHPRRGAVVIVVEHQSVSGCVAVRGDDGAEPRWHRVDQLSDQALRDCIPGGLHFGDEVLEGVAALWEDVSLQHFPEVFDWVHSVDRLKIAERLAAQRPDALPPLQICLQVNVSGEDSKSGVRMAEVPLLARQLASLPRLKLRGLMAIPEPLDDFVQQRQAFGLLRKIYQQLKRDGLMLDTLSMGMTHDLEAAIAEGATIVRVGTAIFGQRMVETSR